MSRFAQRLDEARRLHVGGDLAGAVRAYGELNRESPGRVEVIHPLGVSLAQSGRLAEAEANLLRAVELAPRDPSVLFDFGALREAQGRPVEAEEAIRRVVAVAPDHAAAWAAIGMYRRDAADFVRAAEAFQKAFAATPDRLDLALQAAELMPLEEGIALLIECLGRFPGEESILLPLAELLMRADEMEEAEAVLRTLQGLRKSATISRHLGAVFLRTRRLPEAAAALYDAITRDPNDPDIWTLLSTVRDAVGDSDGASAAVDRAVSLRPENLNLIGLRARFQQHAGRIDALQAGLAALTSSVRATADVRLLSGMAFPLILDSNEQTDGLRERWMETMADVETRPTFIPEPWETVAITGYGLGYHGREDRPLMEAFARASLAASPHLAHTAADLGGSGGSKVRVGFLSAYMRQHSVGRVLVKLMGGLDREKFEVVLFQLPDKRAGGQEFGEAAADRVVRVPHQIDAARALVEAERLDVLIYCDLHLNPFSDALSYSRLAAVQATTWGHPGTGGRESIDYWISCEDWEPAGNERHYTEKLVRLKHAPFVYGLPDRPEAPRSRESFGLSKDARLYGCLQSLFKFHPDFDTILGGILERDPQARLVLVEGPHYTWRQDLKARFARTFDPARVDFLPTLVHKDYLSAIMACDVLLDPIHFGGANTSLDAFSVGKPVVTWPGDQMRSRATTGFYRQIGYQKAVARDDAEYVDLAVRLASDREFGQEACEAILTGKRILFDNLAPVADFESWLLGVRQ